MKLGRVSISRSYVVDLDDEGMVDRAKTALFNDMHTLISEDEEFELAVDVEEAPNADENEIPEFLLPSSGDEENPEEEEFDDERHSG